MTTIDTILCQTMEALTAVCADKGTPIDVVYRTVTNCCKSSSSAMTMTVTVTMTMTMTMTMIMKLPMTTSIDDNVTDYVIFSTTILDNLHDGLH